MRRKFTRIGLALWLTLLFAPPLLSQELVVNYAEVGGKASLNSLEANAFSVVLENARYLGSWPDPDPYAVPTGEEVLYVVTFSLFNDGQVPREVGPRSLEVYAIDSSEVAHKRLADMRVAGTAHSLTGTLLPGATLRIDAGILIPNAVRINSVAFRDVEYSSSPGLIVKPVPAPVGDTGSGLSIFEPVQSAHTDKWYEYATMDVLVESHLERIETPLLGYAPPTDADYAILPIKVRNRTTATNSMAIGNFGGSTLATEAGDRRPLFLLLDGRDEKADFPMLPGQEISLRLVFELPKAAQASRLDLVEHISQRGGISSRMLQFSFSGGDGIFIPSSGGTTGVGTSGVSEPVASQPSGEAGGTQLGKPPEQPTTSQPPRELSGEGVSSVPRGGVAGPVMSSEATDIVAEREAVDNPFEETRAVAVTAPGPVMDVEHITSDQIAPYDEASRLRKYVLQLKWLKMVKADESSGDDPYLMLFDFVGRLGDSSNPPVVLRYDYSSFRFPGEVDWGTTGRSMDIYDEWATRNFYNVRPYEITGVVIAAGEGDESSSQARFKIMKSIGTRLSSAWRSAIARDAGTPYNDFSVVNARKVAHAFGKFYRDFIANVGGFVNQGWIDYANNVESISPTDYLLTGSLNDLHVAWNALDYALAHDTDDPAGAMAAFWINIPGMTDAELRSIVSQYLDGHSSEFLTPPQDQLHRVSWLWSVDDIDLTSFEWAKWELSFEVREEPNN